MKARVASRSHLRCFLVEPCAFAHDVGLAGLEFELQFGYPAARHGVFTFKVSQTSRKGVEGVINHVSLNGAIGVIDKSNVTSASTLHWSGNNIRDTGDIREMDVGL
jgi:hypothetical protein